ncbi:hypothetical protein [Streptomyces sp. NPDC048825]|uniref:hypothetical protein n=1 Tax=Streptomyces sp. NPDC048825 TaxID=3365592 RepID=UPI0037107A0E
MKKTASSMPGAAAVRDRRFAKDFHHSLWERPDRRKWWVMRHRNEADVQDVADELAWSVAVSLDRILPTDIVSATIRHAVLEEYGSSLDYHDQREANAEVDWYELTLGLPVAKMLDWFVRHHPDSAQTAIGDILRATEKRWGIPAKVTGRSLCQSLSLDGKLGQEVLDEYLDRVLPSEQLSAHRLGTFDGFCSLALIVRRGELS